MLWKLNAQPTFVVANEDMTEALRKLVASTHDEDVSDEEDKVLVVPTKIEICSHCEGRGGHSKRFGAFSGRRLEEAQEDEEFWQGYMSGHFDERCEVCDGDGRVKVPSENLPAELVTLMRRDDEEDAAYRAEARAEYLFCGGWREEGWHDSY